MPSAVTLAVDTSGFALDASRDNVSAKIRERIHFALETDLLVEPVKPARAASVRVYLSLPEEVELRRAYARWLTGTAFKATFTQFLSALVNTSKRAAPRAASASPVTSEIEQLLSIPGKVQRQAQIELVKAVLSACGARKVLLGEGATGTGKGLACVAAAYLLAREHGGVVVIGAPTYTLLRQLHADLQNLMTNRPAVPSTIVLGAQEFVSETRLRALLTATDGARWRVDQKNIQHWLKHANVGGGTFDTPWCMESLAQVAPPDFPFQEVALHREDEADEDLGAKAYVAQRSACRDFTGILFATHAMIAIDGIVRRRSTSPAHLDDKAYAVQRLLAEKEGRSTVRYRLDNDARLAALDAEAGVLPDYRYLILDEAHGFKQTVLSMSANEVSLSSLRGALRVLKSHLPAKTLSTFNAVYEDLVGVADQVGSHSVSLKFAPQAGDATALCREYVLRLPALLQKTISSLSSYKLQTTEQRLAYREIKEAAERVNAIQALMGSGSHVRADMQIGINFSPMRFYPRLYSHKTSVAPILDFIWQRCDGSAAVSATLYVPTLQQPHSPTFMMHELAIRPERLASMIPYTPEWLTRPVTLHLPQELKKKGRLWLGPPSRGRTASLSQHAAANLEHSWHEEVGATIAHIAGRADGGTLALFTSYAALEAVLHALGRSPALHDRLIPLPDVEHVRYLKFATQLTRFLDMGRRAGRPVWLATGQAWTGLNLALEGTEANEDQLLTDLVITRVPFASNLGNLEGDPRTSYQKGVLEAALGLRQGIGRLIRREGVQNRHLWMLDARLVDHLERRSFVPLMQVLATYRRRETITRAQVEPDRF